ncbi:metal ABC transporter permease [Pseudoramibacter alactolyticus]|uniref:metal ABC transporter permease n=1 Tax=Pseudoramibacter alactolyticus TaxID=113287 RepID=UPI00248D53A3|nr:metal ABC transporter permease [Pseudoramibacter alactolyticus]
MMTAITLLKNFLMGNEALWVLWLTAVTCALIGSFLVLRHLSMVSDAISHSVLLGIVLAFFAVHDLRSPWLVIGAAVFGVLTVMAVEQLSKTGLIRNHDAVGIVFPLFFALAVILITKYARNVHLDTDMVLMGEVIMAPLYRITVLGYSLPKSLIAMGLIFCVNLAFILIFFKELKLTAFDREFAITLGFSSPFLFYALMTLSSLTAVIAFDAVGAILVVSFLIAPNASAYMLSKDLRQMLLISVLYASANTIIGYLLALAANVSVSGMTAAVAGGTTLLTFFLHKDGLVTTLLRRRKQRRRFYLDLLTIHIGNHMGTPDAFRENGVLTIKHHLHWQPSMIERHAGILAADGLLTVQNQQYLLTPKGLCRYRRLRQNL